MKLLHFLRKHCAEITSVKQLKRAIDTKGCRINGRLETISTRPLKKGDVVELLLAEKNLQPLVLYEDTEICVYDKPAGLISDPKHFRGFLVHRLDKETSGVLIVAKNRVAWQKMIHLFKEKKVKKTYLALVDGKVPKEEGKIASYLVEKRSSAGQIFVHSAAKGKEAITYWKRLAVGKNASLLLCFPETGRTHQIRVHMKEMGHPILGDIHYSKRFVCKEPIRRHMLHAWKVAFEDLEVIAPIPEDFLNALNVLLSKKEQIALIS